MMEEEYNGWEDGGEIGVMSNGLLGDEGCAICLHPITNPMGQECYLKHVEMWLISQDVGVAEMQTILGRIRRSLPLDTLNEEMCVACGKEHLSICSYCFVLLVSRILSDYEFASNLEEEFEHMFSYKGEEKDGFTDMFTGVAEDADEF